ncbi:uncharacterized protein LOC126266588 [Schistocerca gregaria]|uniref:uncharacterized protein LOC126266588 n=1 Tax=Schistocerca gregaria TaxID=7010 RepID=UPI00211E4ABF|nr:uncharacterized protein LOC126266588 [Schistocerca gregaria]
MATSGPNEENAVIDALSLEEILVSSMKSIHLDAANKDNKKDEDITGASPRARRRQFKRCGDEERLSLLKEAQRNCRKLKNGAHMRLYVRELTAYVWSCPLSLRKALEEAGVSKKEARRKAKDPNLVVQPSRPATNGYMGRASIWAPEGFNPLLDLSHLLSSPEPQQDEGHHGGDGALK